MNNKNNWSLYEVFVRSKQGLSHRHVGSLRAPDEEVALQNARDVYTRRNEGISIWVVKSELITSSQPDEKAEFFEPALDKVYRSEEHTSELQSRENLVCRLLLEK